RPRAVVRVDLLAALARSGPRAPRRRAGAPSRLGLPPARGALVTARALSWPTGGRLSTGLAGALRVALVFFPVYLGCGAARAARRAQRHPYARWELGIPFVPFMIVPCRSMFVLFVLPPLQLDEPGLRALTARLILASLVGGAVFLALPAEMGFVAHDD